MKQSKPEIKHTPPVFHTWKTWYIIVLVVNLLVVLSIYLYVSTL